MQLLFISRSIIAVCSRYQRLKRLTVEYSTDYFRYFLSFWFALFTLSQTFLFSCTEQSFIRGIFTGRDVSYRVGLPGEEWHTVESKNANVVLEHSSREAMLIANSRCNIDKTESLDILLRDLFLEVNQTKEDRREELVLDGEPALRVVQIVPQKGLSTWVDTVIVKKQECAFWLQLVAKESIFIKVQPQFVTFFRAFIRLSRK